MQPRPESQLGVWLAVSIFALTLVGYPLAGLVASALGLTSKATSIPLRLFVVVLSFWTVLHFVSSRRSFRIDPFIIAFWWLYLIRLVWDLGTGLFDTVDDALLFFTATVVIPALAIMVAARGYDERLAARVLFVLGALISAVSLTLNYFDIGNTALLTVNTGRLSLETLNPITLGHVAATTVIAALVLWRTPNLPGGRPTIVAGVAFALGCLVLTASRGPILALMLAIIAYALLRGRWGRIVASALAVLIVAPTILAIQGVTIVERFTNITGDLSARQRLTFQGNALEQGWSHPLLGSAYVELNSGQYPHNLIIEAFMAMGVTGLLLFLFLCARGGFQAARRLRAGEVLLPLLLMQYFIAGVFSGSLWGASALWAILMLLAATGSAPASSPGVPPLTTR